MPYARVRCPQPSRCRCRDSRWRQDASGRAAAKRAWCKAVDAALSSATLRLSIQMQVLQIGVDVADAMEYLHPAVVHRDLKSQNSARETFYMRCHDESDHPPSLIDIHMQVCCSAAAITTQTARQAAGRMLSGQMCCAVLLDSEGRAKVCDFGIARFKERCAQDTLSCTACTAYRQWRRSAPAAVPGSHALSCLPVRWEQAGGIRSPTHRTYISTRNNQAGTPAYMAPEMFEGARLTEAVDAYSFGVLLWECITGAQSRTETRCSSGGTAHAW